MKTIMPSPKKALGLSSAPKSSGTRMGDWQKWRCGDRVCDEADMRHVGVIEMVVWSSYAKVRWEESGWLSEIPLSALVAAPKD